MLLYIISDFKSWAREVILWEDTDMIWKNIEYPIKWKFGVLINPEKYNISIDILLLITIYNNE